MLTKLHRVALTIGSVALSFSPVHAYDYIRNDEGTGATNLPIRWTLASFPFQLMLGSTPTLEDGTNYNSSVQAAMQSWNALLGSTQLSGNIVSGTPGDRNRINEIAFAGSVYGKTFESNTLAVATTWYSGNQRTEGDIIFNTAHSWNSYRGAIRSQGGVPVYDIRRVALHELGHTLGLDHPDEAGQTVSAIMNSTISALDALTSDDTAGAQNLYGPPNTPPNDNFANATAITGRTASVTGYNTRATKETGEPDHAGNRGGRSVWWKWQAPTSGTVTLNTRNSYYDTTLGVYTGTAVNALTTITSNDDITQGTVQASSVAFQAEAGTTYYFAVDGFDGDQAGISLNLTLTSSGGTLPSDPIPPATGPSIPTITSQPTGLSTTVGQAVAFAVASNSGTAIPTHQWYKDGNAITGATAASYNIPNVQLSDAGLYTVVVTSPAGSTRSNGATLTVNPVPVTSSPTTGGGGGGGGSPSLWFVAALSAIGIIRRFFGKRQ